MSDRVLVTGATGFIGHHLVETLLEAGDRVACLVRPTSDTSTLPVAHLELRPGDVTDPGSLGPAVANVDVVYHLAGALEGRSLEELNVVNEVGVRGVARACAKQTDPPVLILVSSIEAAGPDPHGPPRTEIATAAPVSNYGRSKLAGERAAGQFADKVPITIVRASGVFGERDPETLSIFKALRVADLGIHPLPRAHAIRVSVIHARDLADLLRLAASRGERLNAEPGSGLYYGAYDTPLTLAELIGMAAEAAGEKRVWILDAPMALGWVVAGLYEGVARVRGRSPGVINLDKMRSAAAGSFTCSPDKAERQLGFSPGRSLEERVAQTVAWYQSEGLL